MTRRLMFVGLLLLGLLHAVALPACQSGPASGSEPSLNSLLGDWTLQSLGGEDVPSALPAGAKAPSLRVSPEGRVSGFGGVNRLSSSLDVEAISRGEFKLSPVAATKMAGPPAAMQLEDRFTRLLGEATGFSVSGDTLQLFGAGKQQLMRLVRGS
jgi:heat shock protein HslJ